MRTYLKLHSTVAVVVEKETGDTLATLVVAENTTAASDLETMARELALAPRLAHALTRMLDHYAADFETPLHAHARRMLRLYGAEVKDPS